MILTCPNCATRYSTTAEAIGSNGRTVRCSTCETTWFVTAEPDILDLQQQEHEEQKIIDTPVDAFEDREDDNRQFGHGSEPALGAHVQIRDMADQRRRNRSLMGVSFVWFVTISLLAAVVFYAFNNRQSIVENYPGMATIYKMFGLEVNELGLVFDDATIRRLPIDGVETLVINGHIINITEEKRAIPMLELSIENNAEEILASWVIEPPQAELAAKERIAYSSEYQNPPVDGELVTYRFLSDDEWSSPENQKLDPEETNSEF